MKADSAPGRGAKTGPPRIKLLREDQVAPALRRMCRSAEIARIAAPFWGEGAARLLPRGSTTRLHILCRFDSPACNPSALLPLAESGAIIRSHPRLHAKIYATATHVIIGSSNPSRYGLTQDGDTSGGSVEANVLTNNPAIVTAANQLLDELWLPDASTRIGLPAIRREIARRAAAPPPLLPTPPPQARTLLAACREVPELFAHVHVAAYKNRLTDGGRRALRNAQLEAAPRETADAPDFRRAWGYQFEQLPPAGSWLVDLDCRRNPPKVWGASRIPDPAYRLQVADGSDVTLTIRGVVSAPGSTLLYRISSEEKRQLAEIASRLLAKSGTVTLAEAVALIDGRSGTARGVRPARRKAQ